MAERTALVVGNAGDDDPGYVGDRLLEHGFRLHAVVREAGQLSHAFPAEPPPDLVLLLGSDWSVHAPVDPAVLEAECDLVRRAAAASVPVLAICYGAQVAAHALGGTVSAAPAPEVGVVHVDTCDAKLVPKGPWTAFHTDELEPPPGATVVARNDCGTQAFSLPGLLGVQFHPEVRPDVLDDWSRRFPELLRVARVNRDELVSRARADEDRSRAAAYALVDAFLLREAAGRAAGPEESQSGVT